MENPIQSAGEAMPKITRRLILGGIAAMSAPTAALATRIVSQPAPNVSAEGIEENPDLIAAYERFKRAERELTAAEEALEWIADEWRHLWPLAPEELLGAANANTYPVSEDAERDIIGRFIIRDTIELTKRFKRRPNEKRCFSVLTPQEAEERLMFWKRKTPTGRTAESLAKNIAYQEKYTKEYEHALWLARQYKADTARLRAAAGVEEAKRRISAAKIAANEARREVSKVAARTADGLRLKALALMTTGFYDGDPSKETIFSEVSRFIEAALALTAGEQA